MLRVYRSTTSSYAQQTTDRQGVTNSTDKGPDGDEGEDAAAAPGPPSATCRYFAAPTLCEELSSFAAPVSASALLLASTAAGSGIAGSDLLQT